MEEGSSRRTSLRRAKLKLWLCCVLFFVAGGETSHLESTMRVSAPHLNYTCPEGATAKLVCSQRGAALHSTDVLRQHWLFTPHSDERCQRGKGPRHTTMNHHSHGNHSSPPGLQFGSSEQNFWMVLQNVTHSDQGRYCCLVLDIQLKNKQLLQEHHTHIVLRVTPRRNGSQDCTVWDPSPSGDYVSVALVLAACILALLVLLLTLGHMYRQRMNTHSSRRAQELVRMDSEAHGHENPVFLGGSPQTKTRTVSQIMTRQASETGRHLLSEPGTPLSPPVHGDVFFPTEDTIPESPDLVQI